MEKSFFNNLRSCIYYILFFVYVCSAFSLLAGHEYNCEHCGLDVDFEEPINYAELGEYEDMYRTFEEKIEEEELNADCGIFKKWNEKAKSWLKKRVVNLLKKCVNLEKIRNAEECAYTVARFKRRVDKYYKTGSLDKLFKTFDKHIPNDPRIASFEKFKNRIRYYYKDKYAEPPTIRDFDISNLNVEFRRPEYNGELDHIPTRTLIGGVEIACGALISVLPFPGCRWLGYSLMSHGASQIYEGYMNQYGEDHGMIGSFND